MKKLLEFKVRFVSFLALLLVIAGQSGCKKSEVQPLTEQKATLTIADPAVDGAPVDELILDSTHETVVPINKKDGWPQAGSAAVGVRIIDAGKTLPVQLSNGQTYHFREVYIVSFRLL